MSVYLGEVDIKLFEERYIAGQHTDWFKTYAQTLQVDKIGIYWINAAEKALPHWG